MRWKNVSKRHFLCQKDALISTFLVARCGNYFGPKCLSSGQICTVFVLLPQCCTAWIWEPAVICVPFPCLGCLLSPQISEGLTRFFNLATSVQWEWFKMIENDQNDHAPATTSLEPWKCQAAVVVVRCAAFDCSWVYSFVALRYINRTAKPNACDANLCHIDCRDSDWKRTRLLISRSTDFRQVISLRWVMLSTLFAYSKWSA